MNVLSDDRRMEELRPLLSSSLWLASPVGRYRWLGRKENTDLSHHEPGVVAPTEKPKEIK